MTIPTNPYVAGNPVGGTQKFIGRQNVLSDVLQILAHPTQNAMVLYGQRRIGKTSILKQLVHDLPREGAYIPVYFNLEDKATLPLEDLLTELAEAITRAIVPIATETKQVQELVSSGLTKESFQNDFLPQALAALYDHASLVLLFDEFDELEYREVDQAVQMFFPYLRQLMSLNKQQLQFIFVIGRQFEDLTTQTVGILKEAELKPIALLTRNDTARLVRLSAQNNSLVWLDSAIDRIWELTHGHPYLTQQLCSIVWENLDQERDGYSNINKVPTAGPEMVDAAISELFERSGSSLQWIWKGLPVGARLVASLLAELTEAGSDVVLREKLESQLANHGVEVHNFAEVYDTLQKWGLIEQADGGYRFRVELLRRWLVQNKPSTKVKEEMAYSAPMANTHYQIGQQALQRGELTEAAREFARAVHINPNHAQARQELAKVLHQQQTITGALMTEPKGSKDHILEEQQLKNLSEQGQQALREGNKEQALQIWSHILSERPDNEQARAYMVQILTEDRPKMVAFHETSPATDRSRVFKSPYKWVLPIILLLLVALGVRFINLPPVSEPTVISEGETTSPESTSTSTPEIVPPTVEPTEETASYSGVPITEETAANVEMLHSLTKHTNSVRTLDFSSDSIRLASGGDDGVINLWSVRTGELSNTFSVDTPIIWSLDFSSGNQFLAASEESTIRSWDVDKGREVKSFEGHVGKIRSLAFSPDGSYLASGDDNNTVRLWNFTTEETLQIFEYGDSWVWSVAFSPDPDSKQKLLAAANADNSIYVWDVTDLTSNEPLYKLTGHTNWVRSIAFSPNSDYLASASYDESVRLWDLANGKEIAQFNEHTERVNSVAFSSDGKLLVSGADDNTIRLWNVEDRSLLKELKNDTSRVLSVAFSPDDTRLASGSGNGIINLWGIPTQ